jgi:hypothetical protein
MTPIPLDDDTPALHPHFLGGDLVWAPGDRCVLCLTAEDAAEREWSRYMKETFGWLDATRT